ncbi:MAG: hypothetical protein OS130_08110 [Thermodesulfobacteriota bacterium]|nr:MAG: hypothetical protein OS130_08110 [Thermodesulfobacteriota bacterium]
MAIPFSRLIPPNTMLVRGLSLVISLRAPTTSPQAAIRGILLMAA